jgi:hypothetical protein
VNNWFNNITNPSESDTNLQNEILSVLGSFEYSYGKYLSDVDVAYLFKRIDELDEKQKDEEKKKKKDIIIIITF